MNPLLEPLKAFSLLGRVAVVTGAASGQGLATAKLFAASGAQVILIDRDFENGEQTAQGIRNHGGSASFHALDLEDEAQIELTCAGLLDEFGQIDVLFNNAGIGFNPKYQLGTIFDGTMQDWNGFLSVNLNGAILMTRALAPAMRARKSGSIIFNASIAAVKAVVGNDAYTASKGAICALTRSIAALLGPDNVRVNTIAPGAISTPMLDPLLEAGGLERRLQSTPLRRLGQPEEIATTALFLASDASSFITGQILLVDGGRSIV